MTLDETHPEIAAQWHPTKNGDLKPEDVTFGMNCRVWWKCPVADDHEWPATVNNRATKGTRCGFCFGDRVSLSTCLLTTHPKIAAEWHPTKNGSLTPKDVMSGSSSRKIWWKCPVANDHEWRTSVCNRTSGGGNGCPCCSGHKVAHSNCLLTVYPEIAAQWHPTKNGSLTPRDVVACSHRKVWWKCPVADDHEWPTAVSCRTHSGTDCPCCVGQKVVDSNCLLTTHPEIAAQWHSTKNGSLTPKDVTAASGHRNIWWKCPVADDHEWPTTVAHRTAEGTGTGCPCCCNQQAADSNCFLTTHPDRAALWDFSKNVTLPSDFTAYSKYEAWWRCLECGHRWESSVLEVVVAKVNGCPRCGDAQAVAKRTSTTEQFLLKARDEHGDTYDYSLSNYTNSGTRLTIICKVHGPFQQSPGSHLSGAGCRICGYEGMFDKLHGHTPEVETVLYLAQLTDVDGTRLGKWGWTTRTFAARFQNPQYRGLNIQPLLTLSMRLDEAQSIEKEFRRRFRRHQVRPQAAFDGATECFDLAGLPDIRQFLETIRLSNSLT